MENKWLHRFLRLAEEIATWSKDPSTKVGAVIVDSEKRIVSVGYNGFPKGMEDRQEWLDNRDEKYPRTIHAEMNAILQAREPLWGTVMFSSFMPCERCLIHAVQAGIIGFVMPKPTDLQLERWGDSFAKAKKYAEEMGVAIVEIGDEWRR